MKTKLIISTLLSCCVIATYADDQAVYNSLLNTQTNTISGLVATNVTYNADGSTNSLAMQDIALKDLRINGVDAQNCIAHFYGMPDFKTEQANIAVRNVVCGNTELIPVANNNTNIPLVCTQYTYSSEWMRNHPSLNKCKVYALPSTVAFITGPFVIHQEQDHE